VDVQIYPHTAGRWEFHLNNSTYRLGRNVEFLLKVNCSKLMQFDVQVPNVSRRPGFRMHD
jgi:hypothetical protein